ncbi:MAG: exported protein of unknown function [Nitrospira sp.]|nr:exported protein of unknown function [Nitrospira sp.]
MMKPFITMIGLVLIMGIGTLLLAPDITVASTAYTQVSVQAIDMSVPSLTFRTMEGQIWTLPAASADLLKGLQKGDTCSLEIDMQDRVTKIVKAGSMAP